MTVLALTDIHFIRKGTRILDGIDWKFTAGEHWAVIGPNGAVEVLGGVYGRINLPEHRKQIGVFQPGLQGALGVHHPGITALDIVMTGDNASLAIYDDIPEDTRRRARELFERHFFGDRGERLPPDRPFRLLSAGERRKILLLRALMSRPELLILDEPYESLDIPGRLQLERILTAHVNETRLPTMTIVHRIEEVPPFVTKVLLLKSGRVFRSGPTDEMLRGDVFSELYEVPLEIGRRGERYYCVPVD
jgi:iron complex transport system ATP-binding protein